MKKTFSTKTLWLIFILTLLVLNSCLLFSYYNFYLSDKIVNNLVESKTENKNILYNISNDILQKNIDESIDYMKKYVKKNGGNITLKTSEGKVIYTNKTDPSKLFSSTRLVIIDGINYELTYSKMSIRPGFNLIRNFMLYEIILVSCVVIIMFFISSKSVIDPMETIKNDINNYKYGKRPYKRKMPKKMMLIQNTFVDVVDSLEIKKEYQNQIIASISHDIKTPLTTVIGYADRLKNNNLTEEKKKIYIDKIYAKSLLMKDILEEFDDYQSCNIKETLKLENITLKSMCNIIKNDFEEELKDKNITLNINNHSKCKSINADLIKLKRVFSNIISNSVRHFNNNPGIINININCINDKIKIEVADNGGGIGKEEVLKKIFEPLYTTDKSRKISGLGLSICKQIISSFDGRIYAKNNNIGGLSIIFLIPKI